MTDLICSNLFVETLTKLEGLHTSTTEEEGFTPKKCPAGYWKEGYNDFVRTENSGVMHSKNFNYEDACFYSRVHTKKDALHLLLESIEFFRISVEKRVKGLDLREHQIEALLFHAYNCGFSNTLYRLIRDNCDNSTISKWWTTHYITAQGKELPGLAIRRQFECTLYFRDWNWAIQVLHENNVL